MGPTRKTGLLMGGRQLLSVALWRLRHPRRIDGDRFYIHAGAVVHFAGEGRLLMGVDSHVSGGGYLTVEAVAQIGERVFLGRNCTVVAMNRLVIGAGTRLAENVSVHTEDHDLIDKDRMLTAPVLIGRDCWIGAGVVITRGVTIGDRAVIGANAVVTRDVPADSLAAGVPAKVLRSLG